MTETLLFLLAFWVALLPIYFWGYALTLFFRDDWSRLRFWVGIWAGSFSVGLVYILSLFPEDSTLLQGGFIGGFFLALYLLIIILTFFGSSYARVFIRKIALLHAGIMFLFLVFMMLMQHFFGNIAVFSWILYPLLFSAFLEESAKHLSSIGLIGRDFSFSQKDVVLMTFFVVLWFVFSENLLYFFDGRWSLPVWIFRSFFTLLAHIFLASICAYFWWKALSYRLFSIRYVATFFLGFLIAGTFHFVYNSLLESGNMIGIFVVLVWGYIFFTRALLEKIRSE